MAMLLIDETLCAKKQLATNFESSEEYWLVKMILDLST